MGEVLDLLLKSDLPVLDNTVALSFLELMELRVVKALVDAGIPLQTVRAASRVARGIFETRYPFATRGTFVEGCRIFLSVSHDSGDADLVELHRQRHVQVTMGQILEPFLKEIEFDVTTSLAHRWWPLGPGAPVVLDPAIAFGAPVIQGSRVRTNIAASMAAEDRTQVVAEALGVLVLGVEAAVRFEAQLAAA